MIPQKKIGPHPYRGMHLTPKLTFWRTHVDPVSMNKSPHGLQYGGLANNIVQHKWDTMVEYSKSLMVDAMVDAMFEEFRQSAVFFGQQQRNATRAPISTNCVARLNIGRKP